MLKIHEIAGSLLVAVVLGCGDSPAPTASPHRSVVPSLLTPAEELARSVALAMADPRIRTQVRDAMRDAPFVEHKLHFQRFVVSMQGADLLDHLARVRPTSRDSFAEWLRGFPELEFYIPDAAHRLTWTGTEDLYVYAVTADEANTPPYVTAFDPVGGSRRAHALKDLSAGAVFALVPVETDFSRPQLPPMRHDGPTVQSIDQ